MLLKKGGSIDMSKNSLYYIENEINHTIEFIEIQMGNYFKEDD